MLLNSAPCDTPLTFTDRRLRVPSILGACDLLLALQLVSMETGIYQDQLPRLFTVYKVPVVHLVWEDALVIYGMLKVRIQ